MITVAVALPNQIKINYKKKKKFKQRIRKARARMLDSMIKRCVYDLRDVFYEAMCLTK